MNAPNQPIDRIREFLRQHGLMQGGDRGQVAQVHHASGQMPARLNTADLQFVLDLVDKIRDMAYRASSGDDRLTMSLIHDIASGLATGMPAPAVGWPPPVDIDQGGAPRPPAHPFDPFEGGGHTRRTRTCAHCRRRCGDVPGGSGVVNGVPVCSPTIWGRPNCYRLIVTHGHRTQACPACDVGKPRGLSPLASEGGGHGIAA